jgi:hypothetical protein
VAGPHAGGFVTPEGVSAEEPPPFSDQLEAWLGSDGPKSIGALDAVFGEKSVAVIILLLMFVPALPLPTGGITHVFGVIVVILAFQLILGRESMWLPERFRQRELGSTTTGKAVPFMVRRIRWFEKFSRQRGAGLFDRAITLRVVGAVFVAFAIGTLVAPPFSGLDTLPALGAVGVALGVILEDMLVLAIGFAIGAGGIALILTVGAALARVMTSVF